MNILNVLLSGLFLSIVLALLSGCIYLLVKEKKGGSTMGEKVDAHRSYMEVWQCPNCSRLSRIARRCKWCMKELPATPKFLTVLEREYTDQLLLPRPEPRRTPPSDRHFPDIHL